MTARSDLDDLGAEEALALVNEGNSGRKQGVGPTPGGAEVPATAGDGVYDVEADQPRPAPTGGDPAPRPDPAPERPRATPWPQARAIAERAARRVPRAASAPVSVPLEAALGLVLAAPLAALTDLPSFDTSAMDGWAVAGPGPWDVREAGVLAGQAQPEPLTDGDAVRIATGARIPRDTTAVLRSEHGRTDDNGRLHATLPQSRLRSSGGTPTMSHGQDIRPRGQECRAGDQLLPTGTFVTPAVLGLAAAAGYDTLAVIPRPRAEVLVLGDELLTEGLPHDGLIRDALGPMLPPWLRSLGADVIAVRRLGDDAEALYEALKNSPAEIVVTTGGTAAGPVDHVHPTLLRLGAELLVHGVQVRPGHPMLLARLKENQHLVGLPGNPLAAVSGLLTLAEPLLRTLAGRAAPEPYTLPLKDEVHGHPHDTRLVPVVLRDERAVPLHYNGPAMLRGIAAAEALAVVPPGGARAGQELELLDLPWAAATEAGVCFT
ncbi:molybdopterin molybdotransferase MoeA [Streptomyces turgidiscabies]|uniref:Molybdopterin molybdenumtransferase n=1 Tax=Streptomyces turgidiscabies (strain Car8) TaxID=698760 RepID=L7EXR3_STRT8|nr:molybdopterin molybdotransferase MoeA [Streptomyces turgidiscabies]ELP63644.1 molybdenum cofactor synthesis domain protein [Streptomyces turgidiscabies Car8]MDX3492197.1 molybdopterin molybdotransferase MoeA [Streptomyces turgidiscabies]GAQ69512.1 molybdopterin molybdenumtransferase [Streptomyces turgidiscabies]